MTRRKQQVPTRIGGIVAVPPAMAGKEMATDREALAELRSEDVDSDAGRFIEAGWQFVSGEKSRPDDLTVYKMGDGSLGLAGKTFSIKVKGAGAMVDELLARHRLRKRRAIGGNLGIMTVDAEDLSGMDVFEYSRRLALDPQIDFAEPVVVQKFDHR